MHSRGGQKGALLASTPSVLASSSTSAQTFAPSAGGVREIRNSGSTPSVANAVVGSSSSQSPSTESHIYDPSTLTTTSSITSSTNAPTTPTPIKGQNSDPSVTTPTLRSLSEQIESARNKDQLSQVYMSWTYNDKCRLTQYDLNKFMTTALSFEVRVRIMTTCLYVLFLSSSYIVLYTYIYIYCLYTPRIL